MSKNINLFTEPNKYAREPKIIINDDNVEIYGYQEFKLEKKGIKISEIDKNLQEKKNQVDELFTSLWVKDKSILDLGCNSFFFGFYGMQKGAKLADGVEIDKHYIDMVMKAKSHLGLENLNIHDINVMDYDKPADLVFAFALIHWIYSCTSDYGSLSGAIKKLADLTNEVLIIEWIEKEDDAINFFKHIDYNKEIISEEYNFENFEKALKENFYDFQELGSVKSTRKVFICYKNAIVKEEIANVLVHTRDKILNKIRVEDPEHLMTFFVDLISDSQTNLFFGELDILVSDEIYNKLKTEYGFIYEKNNIGVVEFSNKQIAYNIILINREKDSLAKELIELLYRDFNKQEGSLNFCSHKNTYIYSLFKMAYMIGATDDSMVSFVRWFSKSIGMAKPKLSNDIKYYISLLKENDIEISDINNYILYYSFPFIYPLENCFRTRVIFKTDKTKYISRLYRVDEKIVKQANGGLINNEFEKLSKMNSDYFPKVYNFNSADSYEYFEMDFIEGISLKDYQIDNTERNENLINDLIQILIELRKANIIHRDISEDNLIYSQSSKPVLIDFGWAVFKDDKDIFTPHALNDANKMPDGSLNDTYAVAKMIDRIFSNGIYSELSDYMKSNPFANPEEYLSILSKENKENDISDLSTMIANKRYIDALDYIERLFDDAPREFLTNNNLHYAKAFCLYEIEKFEGALESVNAEIMINPDFEKSYELQEKLLNILKEDYSYDKISNQEQEYELSQDSDDYPYEVSIIIPAFNKSNLTEQCLEKLFEVTEDDIKYEVIVIDNASSDNTMEILEYYDDKFANFFYIHNEENLGFSPACNQGIEARRGRHALLLNNDIVPTKGWLNSLMNTLNSDKEIGVIGALLLFPDSEYIQHCGVRIGLRENNGGLAAYHFNMFMKLSDYPEATETKELTAVTGACFLIRDEVLNEIGGLDDNYINGFEDIDYCFRVREIGKKVYYCGESMLYHYESMSVSRHKYDLQNWQRFNTMWYNKIKPDVDAKTTKSDFEQNMNRRIHINQEMEYDYKQVRRKILNKSVDEIEFSIIIPVHNNIKFTKNCLTKIFVSLHLTNVEIIIVNNASTDETEEFLEEFKGYVYSINNNENVRYAKANNQGAKIAKGKYLIFLNNDTAPETGWLEALEHKFEEDPTIGIQGAKLLYSDRRIQHAGIVWDKLKENFELHYHIYLRKDENDKCVNKSREFQMVTGALLAIRRELFEEIGGFDEEYEFGHEDLDLCMKVRDKGYKVWYNSDCVSFHYESITKKELGLEKFERFYKNPKSLDAKNNNRFLSKWKDKLVVDADSYYNSDGEKNPYKKSAEEKEKKTILMTMHGWNESGGGTTLPKSMAQALVLMGYNVTVFFTAGKHPKTDNPFYFEQKYENGVQLIGIYNRGIGFIDPEKPEKDIENETMRKIFAEVLSEVKPNLIHLHNLVGLPFSIIKEIRQRNIKTVFTPHNYFVIDPKLYMFKDDMSLWESTNIFENSDLDSLKIKREIFVEREEKAKEFLNLINGVFCVSERQKEIFHDFGIHPEQLFVINQVDENCNKVTRKSNYNIRKPLRISFIGGVMAHKGVHNIIHASSKFSNEELEINIYGFEVDWYGEALRKINTNVRVNFHGAYDSNKLQEIADNSDLIIVPSIWEDCAPLTLAESLAMGVPVIASDIGGVRDFIEDGFNGKLYSYSEVYELQNILREFVDNPEKISKLQENCSLPYDFNYFINHIEKLYSSLISEGIIPEREQVELSFKSKLGIKRNDETKEINHNKISIDSDNIMINIGVGIEDIEGYNNIHLEESSNSIYDQMKSIEIHSDSVDKLNFNNTLEYLHYSDVLENLSNWRKILKDKGEISMKVLNFNSIQKHNNLDDNKLNYLLFGDIKDELKKSVYTSESIKRILESSGFESIAIDKENIDRYGDSLEYLKIKAIKGANKTKPRFDDSGFIKPEVYNYSEKYNPQLNIIWEGTQFVHHSLALINREQCSNIIDSEVANLTIVPYEPEKFSPKGNEKYEKLYFHDIRVKPTDFPTPNKPYVWIRHQWPPSDKIPEGARWIVNQPWEFSALTKDIKAVFDAADEVWTPSNWCRNVYIDSGINSEKIQVIPNGVNPDLFTPMGGKYALKTKKAIKFLFVGGTIYRKGIDVLLDAFVKTFTKYDDVCLVIKDMGGDSFYKGQTAKEYINKLQLIEDTPEIEYIEEMLSEEDIASLYRACDVFVSPYRGEGFSLPTLEAMASGLPVMVTEGGATEDFVDESVGWKIKSEQKVLGVNLGNREFVKEAFLLEPDIEDLKAKLRYVYKSSSSLKSIGLIASVRARKNFSWNRATMKILKRLDFLYETNMSINAIPKLVDKSDAYIKLGEAEIAFNEFDYQTAINLYDEAISSGELNEEHLEMAIKAISLIYINVADYESALGTIEYLDNKTSIDYKYLKAKIYAFSGKLTEALEIFTEIMDSWNKKKHTSNIALTLDHLLCMVAQIMHAQGDIDSAKQVYEASISMNDSNFESYYGLAKINFDNGTIDKAVEFLEKALEINPNYDEALELQDKLGVDA